MEQRRNFLGIPVEGDINYGTERKAQRPRHEFEALVQALLADQFIVKFGWRQYTPYFNDGDACVFGASGFWVVTVNDVIDEDSLEDDIADEKYGTYNHPTLGGNGTWHWSSAGGPYVGNYEALWQAARDVDRAIEGGEFDDVLLSLFGDHATIVVSRDKIEIESYHHD